MIIIAWNVSGSISLIFDGSVFKKVLSIFITFSFLRLIQGNFTNFILKTDGEKNCFLVVPSIKYFSVT
jgi:hypothetical protein